MPKTIWVNPDDEPPDFPTIDPELIKHLRERFPFRAPTPAATERMDMWDAGRQSVIEFLVQEHERQITPG